MMNFPMMFLGIQKREIHVNQEIYDGRGLRNVNFVFTCTRDSMFDPFASFGFTNRNERGEYRSCD